MLKKKNTRLLKKQYALDIINKKFKSKQIINIFNKNKRILIEKQIIFKKNKFNCLKKNRNVCSITGKYKSIFNSLKLSRHTIKNFCDNDKISNYSKLNW